MHIVHIYIYTYIHLQAKHKVKKIFFETGLLYINRCPVTLYVDQTGFEFTEISLPLPPPLRYWD